MPVHSKIVDESAAKIIQDILIGNTKRRMISTTILLIIGFLIHVRNKRPEVDSLRNSRLDKDPNNKKKVAMLSYREAREVREMSTPSSGRGSPSWLRW